MTSPRSVRLSRMICITLPLAGSPSRARSASRTEFVITQRQPAPQITDMLAAAIHGAITNGPATTHGFSIATFDNHTHNPKETINSQKNMLNTHAWHHLNLSPADDGGGGSGGKGRQIWSMAGITNTAITPAERIPTAATKDKTIGAIWCPTL